MTRVSLCDAYADFARRQSFIVAGSTMGYFDAMTLLEQIAVLDPDPIHRVRAGVLAASLADAVMFDFLPRSGWRLSSPGTMEMPAGREAERYVIASAAMGVMFADESFLAVAQAGLGFSGGLQSRGRLASLLAPPLVRVGSEYVLRSSLPLLDDVLAHGHPAARLRQHVADRRALAAIQRPQIRGGQRVLSLDAEVDPEAVEAVKFPVTMETVTTFTESDWRWVERQLRASGRRQDERVAEALAAYRSTRGSREAMGGAAYMRLMRQVGRPSRLAWLIRQRAAQ
jgi:hypothetical protein